MLEEHGAAGLGKVLKTWSLRGGGSRSPWACKEGETGLPDDGLLQQAKAIKAQLDKSIDTSTLLRNRQVELEAEAWRLSPEDITLDSERAFMESMRAVMRYGPPRKRIALSADELVRLVEIAGKRVDVQIMTSFGTLLVTPGEKKR